MANRYNRERISLILLLIVEIGESPVMVDVGGAVIGVIVVSILSGELDIGNEIVIDFASVL